MITHKYMKSPPLFLNRSRASMVSKMVLSTTELGVITSDNYVIPKPPSIIHHLRKFFTCEYEATFLSALLIRSFLMFLLKIFIDHFRLLKQHK